MSKTQIVWSAYLKIGLDSSNFVSEFLGLRRSFRHLNIDSSSIRSLVIEETWILSTWYLMFLNIYKCNFEL